ncbi:hypothetical protein HPP92_013946 [Vanilla planifolia]|uniref:RRM domain-containing protein n=1 Tax=Vanilla planifolia TaxID=51239 RepID=A0A835QJ45_VANPL|nr:hypothetical protein HPP92_013946 [Vanilla planifolia]
MKVDETKMESDIGINHQCIQNIEGVKMSFHEIVRLYNKRLANAKVYKEDSSNAAATQAEKEEVDSRSIYVGNVDYSCTPEEVQQHFQSCGTVNRAVQNALLLNESELHGRQLKVSAKRTNIPGMKQYRGRRPNPYMAYRYRPYTPPPFYAPYGYGKAPRFRRPMRYRPYY